MQTKLPYVLIGTLIGIIVMQWAMPVAESQSTVVRGQNIILEGPDGEVKLMMFVNDDGYPVMGIGDVEGSLVMLSTGDEQAYVRCEVDGQSEAYMSVLGPGASMQVTGSRSYFAASLLSDPYDERVQISVDPDDGGTVFTKHEGEFTGSLPLPPGSAVKATTWGQAKEHAVATSGAVHKPIRRPDTNSQTERLVDEYRRRCENFRR